MSYSELTQEQLAVLVPELLLCGHMIDRSGMGHVLGAFGQSGMTQVAIEEWIGASPVYTLRTRKALGINGDTVEDIFKMMQIDVGAPPQFMDFRYKLIDDYHGEFYLNHCGALIDVEPLGELAVKEMCHDIEDPTFEATAIATNPRARFAPIHRPPRVPSDRHPHCAWTVAIEPHHEALPLPEQAIVIGKTAAANAVLSHIDASEDGIGDYTGPLSEDLRFPDWSRSALARIAEEVALQYHLLSLSFDLSLRGMCDPDTATDLLRKQFTGVAGVTSTRLRAALGVNGDADGLAQVLRLHPAFNPVQYTYISVDIDGEGASPVVQLRIPADSPAVHDGGWLATVDSENLAPIEAIAVGVDAHWCDIGAHDENGDLVVRIGRSATKAKIRGEVAMTQFSTGVTFDFTDRGIPLSISAVRHGTSSTSRTSN